MQLVSTAKTATSATSAANLSSCSLDRRGPERRDSRSRLCDEQTPFAFHFHDERLRLGLQAAAAERAVLEFKAKNNIVATGGTLMNERQLSDISGKLAAARAQTDYYNRDSGRPTRIEDANPTALYELELQLAPLRFEKLANGALRWRAEPKIAYGFAPFTDIEIRMPYIEAGSLSRTLRARKAWAELRSVCCTPRSTPASPSSTPLTRTAGMTTTSVTTNGSSRAR